jgi:hypothetical protein
MSDQRCGTCRWFYPRRTPEQQALTVLPLAGYCDSPAPEILADSFSRTLMKSTGGTKCICYERKERDEREGTD